nr:MAG TPA: hypothetical protein [Caudoviricetes sp.]
MWPSPAATPGRCTARPFNGRPPARGGRPCGRRRPDRRCLRRRRRPHRNPAAHAADR